MPMARELFYGLDQYLYQQTEDDKDDDALFEDSNELEQEEKEKSKEIKMDKTLNQSRE